MPTCDNGVQRKSTNLFGKGVNLVSCSRRTLLVLAYAAVAASCAQGTKNRYAAKRTLKLPLLSQTLSCSITGLSFGIDDDQKIPFNCGVAAFVEPIRLRVVSEPGRSTIYAYFKYLTDPETEASIQVDLTAYDGSQRLLASFSSVTTDPRLVNWPTLLSGIQGKPMEASREPFEFVPAGLVTRIKQIDVTFALL